MEWCTGSSESPWEMRRPISVHPRMTDSAPSSASRAMIDWNATRDSSRITPWQQFVVDHPVNDGARPPAAPMASIPNLCWRRPE